MFHVVAYRRSVDAGAPFTELTPVPDSQVRIEGWNVIVPAGLNHILALYGSAWRSDGLPIAPNRARLDTPSLRRQMLLEVAPVYEATPVGSWEHVNTYAGAPLVLDESEPMRFLMQHGYEDRADCLGVVWLGDGAVTPVVSEYFVARAVAGAVAGTGGWENVPITFDQTLAAGRYAVIGCRCELGAGIAYRLSFVGQSWRPGWLVDGRGYSQVSFPVRGGKWGVWGEFPHDQPPTVDVIADGVGTPVLYLDLVRIG